MNLQVIFFLLTVFVLNLLLYLSFNFNNNISYLILTLLISLNFYLYKRQEKKIMNSLKKKPQQRNIQLLKQQREIKKIIIFLKTFLSMRLYRFFPFLINHPLFLQREQTLLFLHLQDQDQ